MAPSTDMAPDSTGSADAGTAPVTPATPPAPAAPAATAAQPASPQRASLWQSVLQGALTGLAGSAGAKHFGGGLAGGAEGVLRQKQIDIENQRAAAAQAQQIKFQDAESAYKAAQLARQDQQLSILGAEQQDKHREIELNINKARMEYGDSVMPVDNSAEAATNHLVAGTAQAQAVGQNGVSVSPRTMAGVDAVHVVSSNDAPIEQQLAYYNKLSKFVGASPINKSAFYAAGNAGREKLKAGLENVITGKEQATGEFVTTERLGNSVEALNSYIKRAEGDPNTDKNILATAKATRDFQQKAIDNDQARKLALAQGKQNIKDDSAATKDAAKPPKVNDWAVGSMPDGTQVTGSMEELQAAGATGMNKLPAAEASKVVVARQMISPGGLFHAVAQDVNELEKQGKLGVVASRWSDFMAGKVGSDPEFQKLRTDMGLAGTAMMQMHVGARGSDKMLEHFKQLADYRISDAATLRAALGREYNYATEKAMLIPKGKQ